MRDTSLDIIKGTAIFFVLLNHAIPVSYLNLSIAWLWIGQAVPMFLLVTGFISIKLWINKDLNLYSYFSLLRIRRVLIRILAPLSLIICFELIYLFHYQGIGFIKVINQFLARGGWGPGSYYPWIYLQCWFFIPFLLLYDDFLNRWKYKIHFIFFLSFIPELLCSVLGITEGYYRLLFVRYIFVLYLGILWGKNAYQVSGKTLFLGIAGGIFILLDRYIGNIFDPILYPAWKGYHAPAYFYSIIFVYFVLHLVKNYSPAIVEELLSICGRASYHIFLIQMLYFFIFSSKIHDVLESSFGFFGSIVSIPIHLFVIIICGIGFSNIENIIFHRFKSPNEVLAK